jgi:FtsP/CotA-like multicopper oxidase with cupredoxin domain
MTSWKDKVQLQAQRNRQEIVAAKLDRREMMRLGLLTAGGTLVLKQGLSSRAFAKGGADDAGLINPLTTPLTEADGTLSKATASPPIRPWMAPMPLLTVAQPVDRKAMLFGTPDGTTPIDGATKRINHQYFHYDPAADAAGANPYSANPDNPLYDFSPKKFYELTMAETQILLHPDLGPSTYWAFGNYGATPGQGTVPGPLIQAKYGEPILVRYHNNLPSVTKKQAYGIAEMTTHLHNGHTPSESDGNPVNYFNSINDPNAINPNGFKDQHYPNVLAGFTDTQFGYGGPNAAALGNPLEALSSLWYHDHHLDFTAQNVYKGMFGCYNLFDNKDTGTGYGLGLPYGKYDVPIFFHDVLLDSSSQTVFDLFNLDGILGDRFMANGAIQPFFNVDKCRYRFRLYAPGPSRWWEWSLWDGTNFQPFWQISTDGNLLPNAVKVSSVRIAVAERVDIIVDFAEIFKRTGKSRLYFVNRAEQVNGRGPTGKTLTPGTPVVQVNITGYPATSDNSTDPSIGPKGSPPNIGMPLRVLPDIPSTAAIAKLPTRSWRFERGQGGWMVNGAFFDENIVNASIPRGSEEVWTIQNPGGSWRHPVHIHFEEHRMLTRDGVPVIPATQLNGAIDWSRRDIINLQTNNEVRLFMRFRDMKGRYVMHCHNVVHEDHAMMVRWDIV